MGNTKSAPHTVQVAATKSRRCSRQNINKSRISSAVNEQQHQTNLSERDITFLSKQTGTLK